MTPIVQLDYVLSNTQTIKLQANELGCGQALTHGFATLFGPRYQFSS
jgi:hypothetical protein